MEIKGLSGIVSAYKNNTPKAVQKKQESSVSKNIDRVEFNSKNLIESAKTNMSASVNADVPAERIAKLREAVENGKYAIDSNALADSILSLE